MADYWFDQTFGIADMAAPKAYPITGWEDCDWDIGNYPGSSGADGRPGLRDQARNRIPKSELGLYRGVIGVFNFQCNGGAVDGDVMIGLNAFGSTPAWGDSSWLQCKKCRGILQTTGVTRPCSRGGTHDVSLSRAHISITDTKVHKLRTFDRCSKCGLLYASDLSARTVECAAPLDPITGRAHAPSGEKVNLFSRWPDPPANPEFGTCKACRLVLHDHGDRETCPALSPARHDVEKGTLAFAYADLNLTGPNGVLPGVRGYLCHETGHGYGFDHGRGISPRTEAAKDDHWPGAYGDRYDIMSYGRVDSYTPSSSAADADLGGGGPGLPLHHLLNDVDPGPIPSYGGGSHWTTTLRSAHEIGRPGVPAVRFDNYIAEFRPRAGWDAGIRTHDGPLSSLFGSLGDADFDAGAVLIYHVPGPLRYPDARPEVIDADNLYVQVPSTIARNFLAEGDTFETRLGMGNTRLTVDHLDRNGARVTLESVPQQAGSRGFQRWLVLPCLHSDSRKSFELGKVRSTMDAVEAFWNDMAEGSYSVRGAYVVATSWDQNGNDPVKLPWTISADGNMTPAERVKSTIDAALNVPYPWNQQPGQLLWMDWRWFTGIVILRADGGGAGALKNPMMVDAGLLGKRLPPLPFDVIELSLADFSQATLSREIARTLGFPDRPNDRFDLMGPIPGALQYTAPPTGASFGKPEWGPTGPGLGTMQLQKRGWLPAWQVARIASGKGSVTLQPVTKAGASRAGTVRAEVGDYGFELRVSSGWDSQIAAPVVLALDNDQPPQEMRLNVPVSWGPTGLVRAIAGGGGSVTVVDISSSSATLSYDVQQRRGPRVAGGGSLRLGGTILIDADGKIHRLPIGDPSPFRRGVREIIRRGLRVVGTLIGRIPKR